MMTESSARGRRPHRVAIALFASVLALAVSAHREGTAAPAPGAPTVPEIPAGTKITRTGSTTDMAARVLLRNHGLVPDRDVKLVSMNEMGGIVAALKNGVVQGGILSGGGRGNRRGVPCGRLHGG